MNLRFRKLIAALFVAFGLVLSVPTLFSTLGIAQNAFVVCAAGEGWNTDSTGKYYVKNGEKLTGLQKIGKKTYLFDANGYMKTGSQTVDGTTYYFKVSNGQLYTGASGLKKSQYEKNIYYYFDAKKNGTLVTSKWVTYNGKYYYADKSGCVRLGTLQIGNKLYHVTKSGRISGGMKKSSYNQHYYYAGADGVLKTGLQMISGKLYYFSPKYGYRLSGTYVNGSETYFFNTKNGQAVTGWLKINDKYYYHDTSGRRVTGFYTINNKRYFFYSGQNGARLENNWYKIGNYYYYFNASGVLQTGLIRANNRLYFSNSQGQRQSGWVTVSGNKYYFLKGSNNAAATGWYELGGKQYYFHPTYASESYGAARSGMIKIGNYWYYFSPTDFTRQVGWVRYNTRDYYFDKTTGRMLTGSHYIDGKLYHFGVSGGITVNTSSISGNWLIKVNRRQNFIVVYKGNTEIKAFVCSTARDGVSTPTGYFQIWDKLRWHELNGPCWGQYCSHITASILFHSVPYMRYCDPYSLNASYYNKLGSPASAGCIRLTTEHAKWLYDYCPIGTTVYISDSVAKPTTVTIEQAPKVSLSQSYDPTDPNIRYNYK